jgi:ADP-ribose pyrophosphatase YjhB (NUDIX family)
MAYYRQINPPYIWRTFMIGVNVVIIKDGKILLTRRKDFEVWCLPGGHCDAGESMATAAVREAHEEIGFEVRLLNLIGLYSRPKWRNGQYHVASFAAEIIGGELRMQVEEVIEVGYFGRDELPNDLVMGHRQRILDAFDGLVGVVRSENGKYPFGDEVDRQTLYKMCAESELSPSEFYMTHFADPEENIADVTGINRY